MAKYKIIHEKKNCISCGACVAICPEYWELDDEGLAQLKGSSKNGEGYELEIATEEARAKNQEAVDVCPVQVIKLKKKQD